MKLATADYWPQIRTSVHTNQSTQIITLVQKMLYFALLALFLAGLADIATFTTAKRLGGMGSHFIVLQHDGQVFAAGFNLNGQLGLSTTTNAFVPQPMLRVTNATDVSAGGFHSCILDQGKRIKCAGYNSFSQLGDGTKEDQHILVRVLGLDSGIEEVQCGYYSTCARMTSGKAQCWGDLAASFNASTIDIAISGGIQSLSLGYGHVCFVEVGGKLYCMGYNDQGQLGTGNKTDQPTPIQVVGLAAENIVSVACSEGHTCAVNAAGAMFCWGNFRDGRLGNPSITLSSPIPVRVLGITSGAASAWLGWYNSFALMQNGTALAFGKDNYGVFGTGSTRQRSLVAFGQGVSGVVELRGGFRTTCVLLQNDQVKCTGSNALGQLGVGNEQDSLKLVEAQLPTQKPTKAPTAKPTKPTKRPTKEPTKKPIKVPTAAPTKRPTNAPTQEPTKTPTNAPTNAPTTRPSKTPTAAPTKRPTKVPTAEPTKKATLVPTKRPTKTTTAEPTKEATLVPTKRPTKPTTAKPTKEATLVPTKRPTKTTTAEPTKEATLVPTKRPTKVPTAEPTKEATLVPTKRPTKTTTAEPTKEATLVPTKRPTKTTTAKPTKEATLVPTKRPTKTTTTEPTKKATLAPTKKPTRSPL
ncbi:hypothetical protein BASA81_005827 [Batrachochytrium salamandrivorans]|nr:hypothetical protein BASA81_005827 [Batrachochytrium salamandrivorans]